jgi:hypothetical protein
MLGHDMLCISDGQPTAHFGAALWSGAPGGVAADKEGLETACKLGRRIAEMVKQVVTLQTLPDSESSLEKGKGASLPLTTSGTSSGNQ